MCVFTITFFLACACGGYTGSEKPIDINSVAFPSPDKRQVVSFETKDDVVSYLDIKDSKTGRVEGSIENELPPLYSVQWTGDSKSLVLVGHVAHGSTLMLVYPKEGTWTYSIFYPPDLEGDPAYHAIFYDVKKVEVGLNSASVTYELTVQMNPVTEEGYPEKTCLVSLALDTRSGRILESKRTPVR
jgi:hypothetical protein